MKKLLEAHRRQCDSEYHRLKLIENELSTAENLKGDVKKEVVFLDEQNHIIDSKSDSDFEHGVFVHWLTIINWTLFFL